MDSPLCPSPGHTRQGGGGDGLDGDDDDKDDDDDDSTDDDDGDDDLAMLGTSVSLPVTAPSSSSSPSIPEQPLKLSGWLVVFKKMNPKNDGQMRLRPGYPTHFHGT